MITAESIHITPEVLALIAEIDEFKGAWRALETKARKDCRTEFPAPHRTGQKG